METLFDGSKIPLAQPGVVGEESGTKKLFAELLHVRDMRFPTVHQR